MFDLVRQFFLNPQALFGTLLIGIPILIYLINRHKYRRRKWAAMSFLLRAMKRNQRRIQVQNLLLLLVRIAIVLLLAMALARPVFRQSLLSVAPDDNQNWLLAVDVSYSMGYEEGGVGRFDAARQSILQMLDGFLKTGDKVTLMTFAKEPRVLMAPAPYLPETRERVRSILEDLSLSADGGLDLGASFQLVDDLCEQFVSSLGDPEPKRVILFSDWQRSDWLNADGPRDATVEPLLEKIQKEHGEFALARGSYEDRPLNLAVTALEVRPQLVAREVWVELRATVRNFGSETARNIDLSLQVDPSLEPGAAEPQLGSVINVPPGGAATAALAYRFEDPGLHTVVAELRADGLLLDNRRYRVIDVDNSIDVLLVDGEPSADPLERETFHLEVALEPEDDALGAVSGQLTPFRPSTISYERLATTALRDFAVIILANVPELRPETVDALRNYVAAGGALMVFLGDRVQPSVYNEIFRTGEEPLMPFLLAEERGDSRFPVQLEAVDASHPVAAYFAEHEELLPMEVLFFNRYYTLSFPDDDDGSLRIPFRLGDLDGSPAVLDHSYGRGRVQWVTTSADLEWNDFARFQPYVVFVYESLSYLVRFGGESLNLDVGDMFRRRYTPTDYASEVVLHVPAEASDDLAASETVRKDMREIEAAGEFEIVHERTQVPGLYRMDLLRPNRPQPNTTEYFAVNVSTEESDLAPMRDDDFRTHFENIDFQLFDASENLRQAAEQEGLLRGKEYWRFFLFTVLALLVLESILACVFGRRND